MQTEPIRTTPIQPQCHPDNATPSFHPQAEASMSENIKHISDASFEQDVLKSDKPVLVDFWAEWCGPCKMIAPILEEIAKEYDGKLQIAKMDVDANQAVPAKFGIRGIPTLILFKNGVPAAQKVGAMAKGQLTSFIDSNI
jgi:thioredoxin 1